jgi:hypothetical protein
MNRSVVFILSQLRTPGSKEVEEALETEYRLAEVELTQPVRAPKTGRRTQLPTFWSFVIQTMDKVSNYTFYASKEYFISVGNSESHVARLA